MPRKSYVLWNTKEIKEINLQIELIKIFLLHCEYSISEVVYRYMQRYIQEIYTIEITSSVVFHVSGPLVSR